MKTIQTNMFKFTYNMKKAQVEYKYICIFSLSSITLLKTIKTFIQFDVLKPISLLQLLNKTYYRKE